MKIKFKSEDDRIAFASLSVANAAIAEYMDLGVHEAVNHSNGWIELVDENGYGMEFNPRFLYAGVSLMENKNGYQNNLFRFR